MEVCPICLDNIESEKDKYIIGHCNHSFHRKCIIQWFSKSNTCPSCRGIVHNIFYVKTKKMFRTKKNIIEVTDNSVNFYDETFLNLKFFFLLSNLVFVKILDNILEITFKKENVAKIKKIYFVNQNYCLYFYQYLGQVYYYNNRMEILREREHFYNHPEIHTLHNNLL